VVGSLGAPLVPAIAAREGVSLETAQWSLTATLVVAAVATPVMGRLASGRHRRAVMLVSVALVALGALLAALPLGFTALLVGRALQGAAFGISALAMAVARDVLPRERLRSALALLSITNVVSAGLGFPVAALVAEWLGVKGAFAAGGLLTLLTLLLGLASVPAAGGTGRARVDWVGALLLGGSTLVLLLGMSRAADWVDQPALLAGVTLGGVALALACTWWLLRVPEPLVDVRLAVRPGPLAAHVAALLSGLGMYLMIAMVMVLVQAGGDGGHGLDRPVTVAGLMLVPYSLASMVSVWPVGWLADRVGPAALLPLGAASFVTANLLLVVWHTEVWQLLVVMAVGGVGSAATFQAVPLLIVRDLPAAETGSAMAFNIVLRFVGFSFGSALAVTVLDQLAVAGRPSEAGFVAVAWTGAAVSGVATLCCLLLALRAGQVVARAPGVVVVRPDAAP
jgi:MFS family permease